jgi:hypothetical protein
VIAFKFTTGTATPVLTLVNGGVPAALMGATSDNKETSTVIYLKIWWQGDGAIPVIGTTAPSATIAIPQTGLTPFTFFRALQGGGPMWVSVTKLGADSDTTALATGGEVVTLFLE